MNCLEFRRRIETAPAEMDEAMLGHTRECAACRSFRHRTLALEDRVREALRIPVPENLEARILLRQSFPAGRASVSRWRSWPRALAASLVLALAATLLAGKYLYDEARLENEVVALVEAADYALAAPGPLAAHSIAETLAPVGLGFETGVERVSFAGRCLVRGKLSGHLVLREDSEPVTVFLMPDERLVRRARFSHQGWSGVLIPDGQGAIAIVARNGKPADELVERVRKAVRWRV